MYVITDRDVGHRQGHPILILSREKARKKKTF
jgi:hypothetical protein